MTERERMAVEELRRRLLSDPRKPLRGDDHDLLDCLKLAGFEFVRPQAYAGPYPCRSHRTSAEV